MLFEGELVTIVPRPTAWQVVQLGDLLREPLRNGHSAKATTAPDGVRTLTLTAVTVGDFSERNTKLTSADPKRVTDLWLEPGDLLIERSNAPELVGTARLYCGPSKFAIFPDLIIRARLNARVEARYVELVLQSTRLRSYFKSRAKGMSGSMPKIDQQTISEAPIPLPPLDEQKRIVAEIEKQFTRLDAGVTSLKRAQAALKRYRASVLKAACEGRLVPTEAELARRESRSYEPATTLLARILEERRAKWTGRGKYKEPQQPESPITTLPEGWTRATLDQLCPRFADSAHRTPKYGNSGVPALGPRDVVGGRLNLAKARLVNDSEFAIQTARHIPEAGDVIYSRELSLGWGVIVPDGQRVCMSQGMCLFRPHPEIHLRYFLAMLNGPVGRKHAEAAATGSAHPHINLGDIKGYEFQLPPLVEQHRIVAEVERRLSVIEELEAVVAANLQRTTRFRQSILKKAFQAQ